jgi:hypothetical protein
MRISKESNMINSINQQTVNKGEIKEQIILESTKKKTHKITGISKHF